MRRANHKKGKSKQSFNPLYVFIGIALIAAIISFRSCKPNEEQKQQKSTGIEFTKEGQLVFVNGQSGHPVVTIDIEIAEDDRARALGLMHRYSMLEKQGMLFIMAREEEQSFWMKDTYISLDILYVNADMEIVKIQKNTQPFSQESIPSIKPAKYVVEVVAGFCNKYSLKEGDRVEYERISSN